MRSARPLMRTGRLFRSGRLVRPGRQAVLGLPARSQSGSGLLSALFGVGALLAMLGLTVNVALGLWTRSTVDAVAWEAARHVATADPGVPIEQAQAAAISRARQMLGSRSRDVRLEFVSGVDSERVELRVVSPGVSLLPRMLGSGFSAGGIDHTIVMRRETT